MSIVNDLTDMCTHTDSPHSLCIKHKAAATITELLEAAEAALFHVVELESAWQRGIINEPPSAGGTRSNRNVDVRVALQAAIAKARGEQS